jgi:hypothetical protein
MEQNLQSNVQSKLTEVAANFVNEVLRVYLSSCDRRRGTGCLAEDLHGFHCHFESNTDEDPPPGFSTY